MRFRKLRIAWSAMCGVMCLLLIVLWVRSYWWCDAVYFRPGATSTFLVRSDEGEISYGDITERARTMDYQPPFGWRFKTGRIGVQTEVPDVSAFRKIIRWFDWKWQFGYQMPDWFLLLWMATMAATPWSSRWSWRFSLRTLLIATTLVAVVLGVIAALAR
jgi:hypothetical protein